MKKEQDTIKKEQSANKKGILGNMTREKRKLWRVSGIFQNGKQKEVKKTVRNVEDQTRRGNIGIIMEIQKGKKKKKENGGEEIIIKVVPEKFLQIEGEFPE